MSDARETARRQRVSELIEILSWVEDEAHKMQPNQGALQSLTTDLAVNLWVGCQRLFRGVIALIHQGLAEEAEMLNRRMLDDAATMSYLLRHRDKSEELALRFVHASLVRERGLYERARSRGLRVDHWLLEIQNETEAAARRAESLGLKKLRRLPDVGDILKELGQETLYLVHQMTSYRSAHTSTATLATRVLRRDDTGIVLTMTSDLEVVSQVAQQAAEFVLTAHIAAAQLLGWDARPLVQLRRSAQQRLNEWGEAADVKPMYPENAGPSNSPAAQEE